MTNKANLVLKTNIYFGMVLAVQLNSLGLNECKYSSSSNALAF